MAAKMSMERRVSMWSACLEKRPPTGFDSPKYMERRVWMAEALTSTLSIGIQMYTEVFGNLALEIRIMRCLGKQAV